MRFNVCVSGLRGSFIELSEAIKISLEKIGHTVDKVTVGKKPSPYKPNEVTIVVMGKGSKLKLSKDSINILFFVEQWVNREKYTKFCSGYDHIFDIFQNIQEERKSILCPVGWSTAFETNIKPESKHNYFLFGSGNPSYRKKWLRSNKDKILYFYNGCFGSIRDKNIMESRINLMIRGQKKWFFPHLHAMLILCKKKMLMVDEHHDYYPYEPGKHFVVFDDLKECEKWLKNDKRRSEFEQAAYEDIKKNHSFTYYLGRALEEAGIK